MKGFLCWKCGCYLDRDQFAARMPGIGNVCVSCLNAAVGAPSNKAVCADELSSRAERPSVFKPLPTKALARKYGRPARRCGLSSAIGVPMRGPSRLAAVGPSV